MKKWSENIASSYKDILLFLLILFVVNILWKLSVTENVITHNVELFRCVNITPIFDFFVKYNVKIITFFLTFFGYDFYVNPEAKIIFSSGVFVQVVWGCSAVKQSFIFLCIMLVQKGSWKHKLWYLPISIIILLIFNSLRLVCLTLIEEANPSLFYFSHTIMKYIFYLIIFILWWIWMTFYAKKY